jgi:GGDEF domain-containing protein
MLCRRKDSTFDMVENVLTGRNMIALSDLTASEVAEKLRRHLGKGSFAWNKELFSITCSIGLAAVPGMGIHTRHALLESADKSLYLAKRES